MEYANYYTMKSTLKREFLMEYIDSPHSSDSPLFSPNEAVATEGGQS